ncbi:NAD(P)/FAD-dependent oxidoreductase [Actinomadura meridiana]|uniref:NAD(P)/FAD-dependent oxidoreductase n=1 Tax=Actinomadura meridiana TaxID=559626 RepID=A0ABP8C034_9ACTN
MSAKQYDVIVVGARCGGSPTAMHLARKGHRVLLLDRAAFPSDTISTHALHPPGVAALRRWGLLERLTETGCPPIDTYMFDFGSGVITGAPGIERAPVAYAPRRTVLDKILVDAAAEAGSEVRERFAVTGVVVDHGRVTGITGHGANGLTVTERARVVIGADGVRSTVARAVRPERYHEKPRLETAYYSYWSGLPMNHRVETYVRPRRAIVAIPTHDDLTLVAVSWPFAEVRANRTDVEGRFSASLDLVPSFAERIGRASRESRFVGASLPNFFRRPFGPGWALVGDAGYVKDAVTAQGISDAFRDAELCATAVDEALSGSRPYEEAMGSYQAARDGHALPMYEFTGQLAQLGPLPEDFEQLLVAMRGDQRAMDGFARMYGGAIPPTEFFSDENVHRIVAGVTDMAAVAVP